MTRPCIGITVSHLEEPSRHQLPSDYVTSVSRAGGVPLLLPILDDAGGAGEVLDRIDGLLLSGGVDIDPLEFGQEPVPGLGRVSPERDLTDLALCRGALERGMPVLGICRGVQVLAVAAGGTLLQDLHTGAPGAVKHQQQAPGWYATHTVIIEPGTAVHRMLGEPPGGRSTVNSYHHQAVDRVPAGFVVSASSTDGIIEAVEARGGGGFAVGVQWHPERMVDRHPAQLGLFTGLVEAARGAGVPARG